MRMTEFVYAIARCREGWPHWVKTHSMLRLHVHPGYGDISGYAVVIKL